jgi:hypothetical protein
LCVSRFRSGLDGIRWSDELAVLLAACVICALSVGAAQAGEQVENQWTLIAKNHLGMYHSNQGGYRGTAIIYVPPLKRFLAAMGIQNHFDWETPVYSELTLNPETKIWENWFPQGHSDWGPVSGPAEKALVVNDHVGGMIESPKGVLRPICAAAMG